ncbi:hypothetical protein ACKKBG_A08375 [Auxenochlorella protothecoides x Auxenochlorella symbiontica]
MSNPVSTMEALAEIAHRHFSHSGRPCSVTSPGAKCGPGHGVAVEQAARPSRSLSNGVRSGDGDPEAQEDPASSPCSTPGTRETATAMHVPAFEGRGGHSTEVRGGEHVLPASKSTKRRRGAGPQEACPFCGHLYTVRDGLSAKANTAGQRLHQRKCQCRSKTPPCRNCPNCKVDAAVMAITDPDAQMAACEAKGCAICSCQCPSVGKWIEGDAASRKAFKERTERRAEQLHLLSLRLVSGGGAAGAGSDGLPCDPAALLPHIACPAHSGGWSVKRLPADIRSSLSALQQEAAANGKKSPSAGGRGDQTPTVRGAWPSLDASGEPILDGAAVGLPSGAAGPGPAAHDHRRRGVDAAAPEGAPSRPHRPQEDAAAPQHEHHCPHPHADCTSACCSAPTGDEGAEREVQGCRRQTQDGMSPGAFASLLRRMFMEARSGPWFAGARPAEEDGARGAPSGLPASVLLQPQPRVGSGRTLETQDSAHFSAGVPVAHTLPGPVVELARSVFEPALGPPALQAVCSFLSAQCVSSLDDLEFLQLEWMVTALHPHGIPVLLLNKFLTLGRRGARQGAGLADAQVPA